MWFSVVSTLIDNEYASSQWSNFLWTHSATPRESFVTSFVIITLEILPRLSRRENFSESSRVTVS